MSKADDELRHELMLATGGKYTDEQEDAMIAIITQKQLEARIDELQKHRRADAPDDKPEYTAGIAMSHYQVEQRIAKLKKGSQ